MTQRNMIILGALILVLGFILFGGGEGPSLGPQIPEISRALQN